MANIKISELPQATSVSSNDIVPIVQNGTTKQATKAMISPPIATNITSSSTNDEVAGAKAVYDAIQSSGGSTITYGTTDLTPGVSPLADGEFYFVYE